MQNYTGFFKTHGTSFAFPDYIKPTWGAIQGQDSASPLLSHPGAGAFEGQLPSRPSQDD